MNRFGVREICDVVFKPLTSVDIGNQHFDAYQPVLYIDTAKTSSLEGAATTVYAQGGQGNPRLIGWDGEKTLTFTLEDALMSPISFSVLSGAGVIKGRKADTDNGIDAQKVYVHANYDMVAEKVGEQIVVKLTDEDRNGATLVVSKEAPVYPMTLDSAGAQAEYLSAVTDSQVMVLGADGASLEPATIGANGEVQATGKTIVFVIGSDTPGDPRQDEPVEVGDTVRIDCYEVHDEGAYEMQIDAESFAGYYYIEASTLFRDEETGSDLPAEFVIPRGKIQSNFTFTMANSGDPSTFTFTIDCFPAFTKFNRKKKVMAVLQVLDNTAASHNYRTKNVMGHEGRTSDADVDEWYKGSIFNESDEPAVVEDDPIAESTLATNADAPSGFSGKQMSDLVDGVAIAYDEGSKTFNVTGTLKHTPDWDAYVGADQTDYYLPIKLMGKKDEVVVMQTLAGPQKRHIFGQTDDGDDFMVLILAFSEEHNTRTFTVYPTTGDADAQTNGVTYTINCASATFEPGE